LSSSFGLSVNERTSRFFKININLEKGGKGMKNEKNYIEALLFTVSFIVMGIILNPRFYVPELFRWITKRRLEKC
jgi:hypothetical protein